MDYPSRRIIHFSSLKIDCLPGQIVHLFAGTFHQLKQSLSQTQSLLHNKKLGSTFEDVQSKKLELLSFSYSYISGHDKLNVRQRIHSDAESNNFLLNFKKIN